MYHLSVNPCEPFWMFRRFIGLQDATSVSVRYEFSYQNGSPADLDWKGCMVSYTCNVGTWRVVLRLSNISSAPYTAVSLAPVWSTVQLLAAVKALAVSLWGSNWVSSFLSRLDTKVSTSLVNDLCSRAIMIRIRRRKSLYSFRKPLPNGDSMVKVVHDFFSRFPHKL